MTTITIDRALLEQILNDVCGAKLCEVNSMSSRAEVRRLMGSAANAIRTALASPATAPAAALPKGWRVDTKDDLFKTISVVAPNGYSAITTSMARNPENVLRMLVQDLLSTPATAPDELERKPSAKEVAWDRVRRSLVVRNAQITIGEVADTMDWQLNAGDKPPQVGLE